MTFTPRLGAPELTAGQVAPEATVNEQIRYVEQGAGHFIFKDRDLAAPPGSPADGDSYLVAASPTGAWAGQAGKIAFRENTAWMFIAAKEGFTAYINDEDVLVGYNGSSWVTLSAGAITVDNDTALAADSATNVPSQHAVKSYVDGKVAGLSWKQAVRAATTANGTLATAFANGQVIDGVTLATGDRILVKNQTAGSENGIYVVAASGAPARATDADSGAELVNATCFVSEGTVNADTQWTCSTNAPITPGTTALTFAQFTSGGGGLLAANNLSDVASKVAAIDTISVKGTDIAAASTTNLASATGDFVDVTGTTTITALGTAAAGVRRVVRFTGALTLTYNATSLILPTAANIVTAAGDVAMFRSLGSGNWVCTGFLRASGQALVAGSFVPNIQSVASSATVTPTFTNDAVIITAQAAALTLANPTGTAVDEWGIAIRIKDNGTARAITWGTQYRSIGVGTLPTTTVANKTLRVGMIFNNADTKWDVVAVAQEA